MLDTNIAHIASRIVYGNHFKMCLEIDVILNSGAFGRTTLRLPEKYNKSFNLTQIEQITGSFLGKDAMNQEDIDNHIEHFEDTFLLPLSISCARASASHQNVSFYRYLNVETPYVMPVPFMHAFNNRKKNNLIKDIFLVPINFHSFREAFEAGIKVLHNVRKLNILGQEKDLLSKINECIKKSGFITGKDMFLALELEAPKYHNNLYCLRKDHQLSASSLIDYIKDFILDEGVISLNNIMSLAADDQQLFMQKLGNTAQILIKEHALQDCIEKKNIAHTIALTDSNMSSLTKTFHSMLEIQKQCPYSFLLTHQPDGQIDDTFLSDISIATSIGQINFGAAKYMSSMVKYNQILRIEEELKSTEKIYPQLKAFNLEI